MNFSFNLYVAGIVVGLCSTLNACSIAKLDKNQNAEFPKASLTGVIVTSKTKIKKGIEISHDMVVAQGVPYAELPSTACDPNAVLGAHANHDIFPGKVICAEDLEPQDRFTEVSVYALNDIPKGTSIGLNEIKSIPKADSWHAVDKHGHLTSVVARWTRIDIKKGQQICEKDLLPD